MEQHSLGVLEYLHPNIRQLQLYRPNKCKKWIYFILVIMNIITKLAEHYIDIIRSVLLILLGFFTCFKPYKSIKYYEKLVINRTYMKWYKPLYEYWRESELFFFYQRIGGFIIMLAGMFGLYVIFF